MVGLYLSLPSVEKTIYGDLWMVSVESRAMGAGDVGAAPRWSVFPWAEWTEWAELPMNGQEIIFLY